MQSNDEFRQLLETGDVDGMRAAMAKIAPQQPQPQNREVAEIVMHRIRTGTSSISFQARAYSHAWLIDRDLLSDLPDELKPKAERLYPRIVAGIGISINSRSPILRPVTKIVQQTIVDKVEELHADGVSVYDPLMKHQMEETYKRTMRQLLGRISPSWDT